MNNTYYCDTYYQHYYIIERSIHKVKGNTLYIYGGMTELGDIEVTLDDCWCDTTQTLVEFHVIRIILYYVMSCYLILSCLVLSCLVLSYLLCLLFKAILISNLWYYMFFHLFSYAYFQLIVCS